MREILAAVHPKDAIYSVEVLYIAVSGVVRPMKKRHWLNSIPVSADPQRDVPER